MLTIAGAGPGNIKYLTIDVKERIEKAEYILAFGRIADSLKGLRDDIKEVSRVDDVIEYLNDDREVLLLASGDPNFFGITEFIKRKGVEIKEILPGISSFQYLMSKLQKSWQDAELMSLHGREDSLAKLKEKKLGILLIDKDNTPDKISKELYQLGFMGKIYAGYNLSYDNERIIIKNIGEDVEFISSLGVVVVENEMD